MELAIVVIGIVGWAVCSLIGDFWCFCRDFDTILSMRRHGRTGWSDRSGES